MNTAAEKIHLNTFRKFTHWLTSDGRHFQIISQISFLLYGIYYLGWDHEWLNFLCAFIGCLGTQLLFIEWAGAPHHSAKSAIISSLGLSLLFKANSPLLFLCAGALAVGQKFAFRYNGKHLWNPANFGIIATILLSGAAWVSPGQWGSGALIAFIIGTGALAVLSKIKRLETGLAFILTLAALEFSRFILYLGWDLDVWIHKMSNGSIWLFAFFMITDPMTTPNKRSVRIVWSIVVAGISFYLSNFHFINAAPMWVLFLATPFNPLLDKIFSAHSFEWLRSNSNSIQSVK